MFPWYYLLIIVCTTPAALLLINRNLALAIVLGVVAVFALYCRVWLLPRINRLRHRRTADDEEATARFEASHRLSVWINGVQLLLVFAVLILFSLSLQ